MRHLSGGGPRENSGLHGRNGSIVFPRALMSFVSPPSAAWERLGRFSSVVMAYAWKINVSPQSAPAKT